MDEYGDRFSSSPLLLCAVIGAVGFSVVMVLNYFLIDDGMADFLIDCVSWLMFGVPVLVVVEHVLSCNGRVIMAFLHQRLQCLEKKAGMLYNFLVKIRIWR